MSQPEILPCPACGGECKPSTPNRDRPHREWVYCTSRYVCGYESGCQPGLAAAIAAHNRIASAVRDADALRAEVERLREALGGTIEVADNHADDLTVDEHIVVGEALNVLNGTTTATTTPRLRSDLEVDLRAENVRLREALQRRAAEAERLRGIAGDCARSMRLWGSWEDGIPDSDGILKAYEAARDAADQCSMCDGVGTFPTLLQCPNCDGAGTTTTTPRLRSQAERVAAEREDGSLRVDPEWVRRMADREDGKIVSVGGLVTRIEREEGGQG